jgi:hypothetical protein
VNIAICSAFRDAARNRQAHRFLKQVHALKMVRTHDHIRVIAGEGDSTDGTRGVLLEYSQQLGVSLTIADTTHGGKRHGSTEDPARMAQLSNVCNTMLDSVADNDDLVFYVESDLLWDPFTISKLIDFVYVSETLYSAVAPLVMAGVDDQGRDVFYDIWAFRLSGERFGSLFPYHPKLGPNTVLEMDSVGSCFVMKGRMAREARIRDNNALVGFFKDAKSKGYRVWVHGELKVQHP